MARQPAEARHHSRKLTVRQYPPSAGTLPEFGQQGGRSASIDDTLPPAGNPEVSPEGMTLVLSHEGKPSSPERTALAHAHRTNLSSGGRRLRRPARPAKEPPASRRADASLRTKAATRTPSAPDTRASTNAGVGPVVISDVLIAPSAGAGRRVPESDTAGVAAGADCLPTRSSRLRALAPPLLALPKH